MAPEGLVRWRPIEGGWYRLDDTVCTMHCVYCSAGVAPLMRPPSLAYRARRRLRLWTDTRRVDDIVAEVDRILAATPPTEQVHLTADDLMAFEGFIGILEAYKRHGRTMELITPGLRLADPAFAEQVSRYDIRLTVTCLAATREVYTAMTHNPEAYDLVRAAMANMRRLKIAFGVNCVITSINCGSLYDVARYLFEEVGLENFTMPYFYLEQGLLTEDPKAPDLLAPFDQLDAQLARIVELCEALDRSITLVDVTPCQLRSEVIGSPRVRFRFVHNPDFVADSPTAYYRAPSCDDCTLNGRCSHVSKYFHDRHPGMTFDAARVNRDYRKPEPRRPHRT